MPLGTFQKGREAEQCQVHLDVNVVGEKPLSVRKTLEKDYPRDLLLPWWCQSHPVFMGLDSVPPLWAGSSHRQTSSSIKILGIGYSLPDATGILIPNN